MQEQEVLDAFMATGFVLTWCAPLHRRWPLGSRLPMEDVIFMAPDEIGTSPYVGFYTFLDDRPDGLIRSTWKLFPQISHPAYRFRQRHHDRLGGGRLAPGPEGHRRDSESSCRSRR